MKELLSSWIDGHAGSAGVTPGKLLLRSVVAFGADDALVEAKRSGGAAPKGKVEFTTASEARTKLAFCTAMCATEVFARQ